LCQKSHTLFDAMGVSIELSTIYLAWRFSELSIHPTRQTSVRATFGCSEISKENWRTAICKTRKKFSRHFKNCEIRSLLRSFKWYSNHGAIGCAGSLNITENTFVNDICTNRRFHGQGKAGVCSHYFSAFLYMLFLDCVRMTQLVAGRDIPVVKLPSKNILQRFLTNDDNHWEQHSIRHPSHRYISSREGYWTEGCFSEFTKQCTSF
jgi:hypothetical protein